jgi:hypothetical protein
MGGDIYDLRNVINEQSNNEFLMNTFNNIKEDEHHFIEYYGIENCTFEKFKNTIENPSLYTYINTFIKLYCQTENAINNGTDNNDTDDDTDNEDLDDNSLVFM